MSVAGLPTTTFRSPFGQKPHWRRRWMLIALAVLLVGGALFAAVAPNWPFRFRNVKPLLEDVFASSVTVTGYHRTYFPRPGFVAYGLILHRKSAPGRPPVGTVQEMVVQVDWLDLLLCRHRIQSVRMQNLHVVLPPPGSRALREEFPAGSSGDFDGPDTPIEDLEIIHSLFEIERDGGGRYSFPLHDLRFTGVQKGKATEFVADLQNALPQGQIHVGGRFGPVDAKDLAQTPLSGKFTFTGVHLQDLGNVRGMLNSSGSFQGRLGAVYAEARSTTPDFSVDDGTAVRVDGRVRSVINGLTGEVALPSLDLTTGSSKIHASGQVAGHPKAGQFDVTVQQGRAEDLLRPFLHKRVPITGAVTLQAHAFVAPTREGEFLHRLHLDGRFDVPAEKLTDAADEKKLSEFSQRAQGNRVPSDPAPAQPEALSSLSGSVTVRDAVLRTHDLQFAMAGASARLAGMFNLRSSEAHLAGDLRMKADISHTANGFKSAMLKLIAPFFRGKHAGAVVPIAITGKPGTYQVRQNIGHRK